MAHEFELELIQPVLDKISAAYAKDLNFLSVAYVEDLIEIQFRSLKGINTSLFETQQLQLPDETSVEIPVRYIEGGGIAPSIGIVTEEMLSAKPKGELPIMGGDRVINIKDTNYGTLGLMMQRVSYEVGGRAGKKTCTTKNAMISNNHVLARSDRGAPGEIIRTTEDPEIAALHCFIPFKILPDLDFATAQLKNTGNVKFWWIRDIGDINNKFVTPKRNEKVRKYGATSGFTQGTVIGIGNVNSGGYSYRGIYITNAGFACPGDSGAVIVNAKNDILGMHTWGDHGKECEDKPRGYFYTFNIKKGINSVNQDQTVITASKE